MVERGGRSTPFAADHFQLKEGHSSGRAYFFFFFLHLGAPLRLKPHLRFFLQHFVVWPSRLEQTFGRFAGQVSLDPPPPPPLEPLQAALPAGVLESAGHWAQLELPAFGCAVPAGQVLQAELPAELANVPGGHTVHWALSTLPKVPAGQMPHSSLPGGEAEPVGHAGQLELPVFGCAVPAGQGVQAALPAALNLPAAQDVHCALPASLNVPARHAVHWALPAPDEVPAAQGSQSSPPLFGCEVPA